MDNRHAYPRFGARSRRGIIAATFVAAAAIFAAAAVAVVLPPTNFPVAGSNFQGADGNQANPQVAADAGNPAPFPATVDWQAAAVSGVNTVDDPDATDSIFNTGSHENRPEDWDISTLTGGSTPGKSNIFTAWSYVQSPYLYVAFDRQTSGGNVFFAFELNQDARTWKAASGDWINCRKTNDLIISYAIQNNSNVSVIAQKWTSDTSVSAADVAAGYTNGEGCAKTGHFDNFDLPATVAQGGVNQGVSIANFLPHTPSLSSLGAELFGEAAINVVSVLNDYMQAGCVSYVQESLHGRSSESAAASLQDLTSPVPVSLTNCSQAPTAVDVHSFSATRSGSKTLLRWRTGSEARTVGFALYRESGHGRAVVNQLVPVRGSGARYSVAVRGNAKRFWLQAVHTDGTRSWVASALSR